MSEADLVRKIINSLTKEVGGYWIKVAAGPFQQAGLPDIIGVCKGKFFGLEVKLPGKERNLTKIQVYTLEQIRNAGGVGEMVTSVASAKKFVMDRIKDE